MQPHSRCPRLSLPQRQTRVTVTETSGPAELEILTAGLLRKGELASQNETKARLRCRLPAWPVSGRGTEAGGLPARLHGGSRAPGRHPWALRTPSLLLRACESVSQPGARPRSVFSLQPETRPGLCLPPRRRAQIRPPSACPESARGPAGTRRSSQSPSLRVSERQ